MVFKTTQLNPPPGAPLDKGQPASPAPPVVAPLPSPDETRSSPSDPLSSAFTTDQVPRAPISSPPPPPVVARNNPFGPEFFAELDEPPPPTEPAFDDEIFNRNSADRLSASDVAHLLGYLRQV